MFKQPSSNKIQTLIHKETSDTREFKLVFFVDFSVLCGEILGIYFGIYDQTITNVWIQMCWFIHFSHVQWDNFDADISRKVTFNLMYWILCETDIINNNKKINNNNKKTKTLLSIARLQTSNGINAEAQGSLKPNPAPKSADEPTAFIAVKGSFSFVAADGQTYSVSYIADENGKYKYESNTHNSPNILCNILNDHMFCALFI